MKDSLSKGISPSKKNSILSVILVNYNGKDFIGKCLDSIEKNLLGIQSEVIVVDNHSTDGSVELLQNRHPNIRLLRNHENLGFSKSNNLGIKASNGFYILIINPDTYVYSDAIRILLTEIKENSDVGAVGPALLNDKNNYQLSFGGRIGFFSELAKKLFLNRLTKCKLRKNPQKRNVQWLSGACFISRRDVLERVGMFDERFFLYFEDIDLCTRMRKSGWRLVYLPEAKVFHQGGASTELKKLNSRFHYRKSQLYFYKKHSSILSLFLLKFFFSINFIFILFQGFFKRSHSLSDRLRFFKLLGKKG